MHTISGLGQMRDQYGYNVQEVTSMLRRLSDRDFNRLYVALRDGDTFSASSPKVQLRKAEVRNLERYIVAERQRRAKVPAWQSVVPQYYGARGLQGLGYYNTNMDMLDGFAQVEDNSAVLGVSGLGAEIAVNGQGNFMKAIMSSAAQMQDAVKKANKAKIAIAKTNPLAAQKLMADAKRKGNEKTNVQTQIIDANKRAAQEAKAALIRKQRAAAALKRGDKQMAAAETISYMQHNRRASMLAMKAEKTRMAIAADRVAAMLEEQAKIFEMAARKQISLTGRSMATDKMLSQVAALQAKARGLRASSAVVAQLPDVPTDAPTPNRVAELANKYNVRTAMQNRMDDQRAMISVLSDIGNQALAQAPDYEGAVMYYGNDLAGRLMADIEYSNVATFLQGLNAMDGLGISPRASVQSRSDAAFADMDKQLGQKQATAAAPASGGGWGDWWNKAVSFAQNVQQGIQNVVQGGQAAMQTFNTVNRTVQDGINAGKKVYEDVRQTAASVGIPMPAIATPPMVVSGERQSSSTAFATFATAAAAPSAPAPQPQAPVAAPVAAPVRTLDPAEKLRALSDDQVKGLYAAAQQGREYGDMRAEQVSAQKSLIEAEYVRRFGAGALKSGGNMMLYGGIAVAALAAIVVVPKLMKKPATA